MLNQPMDLFQKINAPVRLEKHVCGSTRSQMAERLGNRAINQKVTGSCPAVQKDVVSLGKALHPTCLGGECPCTYCKSLWINDQM